MVNPSEVQFLFDWLVPYISDMNLRQLTQFQRDVTKALIDIQDDLRNPGLAGANVLDELLQSSFEKLSLKGRALLRELFPQDLGANFQIDQGQRKSLPVPRSAEIQKTDIVIALEYFLKSIIADVAELNVHQFFNFKKQIVHLAMAVFDNPNDFKHRETHLIHPAPESLIFDHLTPDQFRLIREIVAEMVSPQSEVNDNAAQISASEIGGAEEGTKDVSYGKWHTPTLKPLNLRQATGTLPASSPISTAVVAQHRGGSLLAPTNSPSPEAITTVKTLPYQRPIWRRNSAPNPHANESKTKLSTGMNKASANQKKNQTLVAKLRSVYAKSPTKWTQSGAISNTAAYNQPTAIPASYNTAAGNNAASGETTSFPTCVFTPPERLVFKPITKALKSTTCWAPKETRASVAVRAESIRIDRRVSVISHTGSSNIRVSGAQKEPTVKSLDLSGTQYIAAKPRTTLMDSKVPTQDFAKTSGPKAITPSPSMTSLLRKQGVIIEKRVLPPTPPLFYKQLTAIPATNTTTSVNTPATTATGSSSSGVLSQPQRLVFRPIATNTSAPKISLKSIAGRSANVGGELIRMNRRQSITVHSISIAGVKTERRSPQSCAVTDDNSLDQTNDLNGKMSPPLATSPERASKPPVYQSPMEEQQRQHPNEKVRSPSLATAHLPEAWEFGLFYPDFKIEPEDYYED